MEPETRLRLTDNLGLVRRHFGQTRLDQVLREDLTRQIQIGPMMSCLALEERARQPTVRKFVKLARFGSKLDTKTRREMKDGER